MTFVKFQRDHRDTCWWQIVYLFLLAYILHNYTQWLVYVGSNQINCQPAFKNGYFPNSKELFLIKMTLPDQYWIADGSHHFRSQWTNYQFTCVWHVYSQVTLKGFKNIQWTHAQWEGQNRQGRVFFRTGSIYTEPKWKSYTFIIKIAYTISDKRSSLCLYKAGHITKAIICLILKVIYLA